MKNNSGLLLARSARNLSTLFYVTSRLMEYEIVDIARLLLGKMYVIPFQTALSYKPMRLKVTPLSSLRLL